ADAGLLVLGFPVLLLGRHGVDEIAHDAVAHLGDTAGRVNRLEHAQEVLLRPAQGMALLFDLEEVGKIALNHPAEGQVGSQGLDGAHGCLFSFRPLPIRKDCAAGTDRTCAAAVWLCPATISFQSISYIASLPWPWAALWATCSVLLTM